MNEGKANRVSRRRLPARANIRAVTTLLFSCLGFGAGPLLADAHAAPPAGDQPPSILREQATSPASDTEPPAQDAEQAEPTAKPAKPQPPDAPPDNSPADDSADQGRAPSDGAPQERKAAGAASSAEPAPTADKDEAVRPEAAATAPAETAESALAPRFELRIPSAQRFFDEARRSHAGIFLEYVVELLRETSGASAEGFDSQLAMTLITDLLSGEDSAIEAALFAPDLEGRTRWAIRSDWPIEKLLEKLAGLLQSEEAAKLFTDITLSRAADGSGVLALPQVTLAYVSSSGHGGSLLASHQDLAQELRGALCVGVNVPEAHEPVLLARLNLKNTEKDSGQTAFSKFSIVTSVDYVTHVDAEGNWADQLQVNWPPVSGMALKALIGRVKRTFYVPDEAFGAFVFNTAVAPSILEQLAGFGPQMVVDGAGGMGMVGDMAPGPLSTHVKAETCVVIMPGDGFLPVPDVVVQWPARNVDDFADDVRASIESINDAFAQREQMPPWTEITVRERSVFWREASRTAPGVIMPVNMRPVLFTTREMDAKGRDRDLVVLGWTSTDPAGLVRRWLDLPRTAERRFLPDRRKTNGQLWVNWRVVYDWIHPYFNLGMSVVSTDVLLPGTKEAHQHLVDGWVTSRLTYAGLLVNHQGPVPMGVVALPTMISIAAEQDRGGGTDLARERLAAERLRVLHHHCKLFRQDVGRWPARVAELDGYVDFAGHPELLRLKLSSQQRWAAMWEDMFGEPDKDEGDGSEDDLASDEVYADIKDDLYVIEWGTSSWTLGIKAGTLNHLERIYIDQDGVIHRVPKPVESPEKGEEPAARGPQEPRRRVEPARSAA